ncbi:Collagen triple helix repeat-containing protein [Lactococcus chungangensis CAU 28 = DSM 22330]|uniref:Collagen triple helix repeat-containing protein n=1 Tax=Pseudolactococcus chungangensis CAU 28 = DSM 22330 TaxID=1122154 RepID=A0A1K2HBG8_9LACT|nr:collagen-like protein [Lactococcus chungangensis]SFZ74037.1 Collagen triple helix repeat-containing protein [Lactococcus chungangensis CAU 28 = DSM 22330]
MTKTLTLDVTSFKFADNETDLSFRATQNGVIISDSTLSATIKIKQVDVGYLKSVSAKWVDKRIVISSGDLSDLPVGSYSLELWLSSSSGYEIYPDSGFVNLYINQNATGISGNLISSITLGEFQQQFSDLAEELIDNLPEGKVGPQGEKGDTGPQGVQGIQGERGEQGEQGLQGIQGVSGKDFSIAETFSSVASMSGAGLTTGDFVMISSTVEDPDNAKMYLWNGTEFTFITDMSGATGIKGDTGEQGIQGEQGVKGDTGPQGIQGIQGVAGINGTNGKDAVINVVTQAEYDALPDKTGVYFIGG